MTGQQTPAVIALLRQTRTPGPRIAHELESGANPRDLLERELNETAVGQRSLLAPDSETLIAAAASDFERWRASGIALITVLDDDYPLNLRAVHDRPPLIFVAGALRPEDRRSVAVVGSRRPSADGLRRARALARHLAESGHTVVSGLAAGIDTAAHTEALAARGRTVAVIGTGLHQAYPPENARLQHELATRGAVVSALWPGTPPSRETFPARNGVMSGLAQATAIVEAGPRSGTRIQARLALAHGRPVFVARALLGQDWASDLAQRPGVHAFGDPEELTAILARLHDRRRLTA